jgi:hypothetical protein
MRRLLLCGLPSLKARPRCADRRQPQLADPVVRQAQPLREPRGGRSAQSQIRFSAGRQCCERRIHLTGIAQALDQRAGVRSVAGGLSGFTYFFNLYVTRLGFLDGRAGTAFHVLQGFWHRYLVDAKVAEVERYMRADGCDVAEAIAVLDIQLERPGASS